MKKNRLIFYTAFALFHLFLVIFTFYVDANKNDFSFLTKMLGWISVFKWGAVLGLLFLIVDLVWSLRAGSAAGKENAALQHQVDTLKAKMFDLQEEAKNVRPPQPPTSYPKA